jgi:N-methylhydantoinase B
LVSPQAAAEIYGVVLTSAAEFDADATRARRESLRAERILGRNRFADCPPDAETIGEIGPALKVVRVDGEVLVASRAGAILARGSTRWRAGAVRAPFKACAVLRLHEGLEMSSFFCPVSGDLLAVDVHEKGAIPPDDIVLELENF